MSDDYVRGEMDITTQEKTWTGFIKVSLWSSFIISLVLAYAVFTITMGMNWLVALGLLALVGIVGGLLMGMGSAWIVTVVGLSIFGVILHLIILFAKAVL